MGMGVEAAGVQSGMNMATTLISNELARSREREARRENYMYNEMAATNADKRTRALYNDLQSPAALLAQYRDAGLSPSLMFGGGGPGGQTSQGAQGGGASGISPTTYGVDPVQMAQIELMKAQARDINASADTKEGKNERGNIEIQQLKEQLKGTWLENELKAIETRIANINAALQTDKADLDLKILRKQLETMERGLEYQVIQNKIAEATQENTIKYLNRRIKEQTADILLKNSQTNLNKEAAAKLVNDVLVNNAHVQIEKDKVKISEDNLEAQIQQWGIENGYTSQDNARQWTRLVMDALGIGKEKKGGGLELLALLKLLIK